MSGESKVLPESWFSYKEGNREEEKTKKIILILIKIIWFEKVDINN